MAEIILMPPVEELDDAALFEILNGVRVGLPPMSAESQVVASRLATRLSNHAEPLGLGEAYSFVLVPVSPDQKCCRRPDVVFVPYSRWPKGRPIPVSDVWDVLPTLCVEVVSPADRAEELCGKLGEYFYAGVQLVWVVHPRQQLVFVYRTPTDTSIVPRTGVLAGGDVLPGFLLPLADLFPETDAPAG